MRKTILKIGFFSILLLSVLAFGVPHQAIMLSDRIEVEPCSMENQVFQAGEEVVYKLYYNWNFVWLSAGEVVFRVDESADQYRLTAEGRTYKSYEWFFKVRDKYETYIDKNTLLPNVSSKDINEGKYTMYSQVVFDQDMGTATNTRGKTKDKLKTKEYAINNCMHDILSVIYFVRNIDFDNNVVGSHVPMEIFMDRKTWPVQINYDGKEANKKIRGQGKMNTIKVSPQLVDSSLFEDGTEMNIWMSDDKNRIPVLIESPVSVGSVKAVLQDYKGLRYDFLDGE